MAEIQLADPAGPVLPPGWQPILEGQKIHAAVAQAAAADIRRAPPPEPLPGHRPLGDPLFVKYLPNKQITRQGSTRFRVLIRQATALSKLRGPLFYSAFFVACNLKKHIQLAPDFVEHDRVYHPLCTFGPPSTADIEDSLNDLSRFSGCLLFQDPEAANTLSEIHKNVRQIVLIACPLPAMLSDEHILLDPAHGEEGLLKSLQRLVLRDCDELTKLPDKLADCVALRTLVVHNCRNLRDFGVLLRIPNLLHLFLLSCPRLQGHLDLSRLKFLRLCVARQCGLLTVIVDSSHERLLQLVLGRVFSLRSNDAGAGADPPYVTLPTSLLHFGFEDTSCLCPRLFSPDVNQKVKLEGVSFSRYKLLSDLPGSIHLGALQQLNIIGCTLDQQHFMEHTLPQLTSLEQLRASIALDQISKVDHDWPPHGGSGLTLLILQNAQDHGTPMRKVPSWVFPGPEIQMLKTLEFSDCNSLTEVNEGISKLTNLSMLALKRCAELVKVPQGIKHLWRLTSLDLGGCSGLTTLPYAVGQLSNLKRLSLSDCSSVTFLPRSICKLTGLTHIVLSGCTNLDSLPHGVHALAPTTEEERRRNDSDHGSSPRILLMPQRFLNLGWGQVWPWLQYAPALQYALAGAVLGLLVWVGRERSKLKDLKLDSPWLDVFVGAIAGAILFAWQSNRALEERQRDSDVRLCLVDTTGSGLPQKHVDGGREEDSQWQMQDLVAKLAAQGRVLAFQRLLRDSEGSRASLEKLSFVAAALAAAARLTSSVSSVALNADAAKWLDVFRTSQQISFVLSMTLIMFVFIGGIPTNEAANELVRVGAVWTQFAVGGCLLMAALLLSVLSFFARAFIVDAVERLGEPAIVAVSLDGAVLGNGESDGFVTVTTKHSIEAVFIGACWLLALVLYAWWSALKRLWPGWKAILAFVWDLFASHMMGKLSSVRGPPRGAQEVLEGIEGSMQGVLQASSQQVALLKPVSRAAEAWASEGGPEEYEHGNGGGGRDGGGGGGNGGSVSRDDPTSDGPNAIATSRSVRGNKRRCGSEGRGHVGGGLPGDEHGAKVGSGIGLGAGSSFAYAHGGDGQKEDLGEDFARIGNSGFESLQDGGWRSNRSAAEDGGSRGRQDSSTSHAMGLRMHATEDPDRRPESHNTDVQGRSTAAEGHVAAAEGHIAAAEGPDAAAEGPDAAAEGPDAAAEGRSADAEGPAASGESAESSHEIGAAQGSSSGQMVHPGGLPPSYSSEERVAPDQSEELFITAKSTFSGSTSGSSTGNTSDSPRSGREEGSVAQASGAAAGPGVVSARNDAEQPGGSGEAVNPVNRATREVSTGEVTVDLPDHFIVRREYRSADF